MLGTYIPRLWPVCQKKRHWWAPARTMPKLTQSRPRPERAGEWPLWTPQYASPPRNRSWDEIPALDLHTMTCTFFLRFFAKKVSVMVHMWGKRAGRRFGVGAWDPGRRPAMPAPPRAGQTDLFRPHVGSCRLQQCSGDAHVTPRNFKNGQYFCMAC